MVHLFGGLVQSGPGGIAPDHPLADLILHIVIGAGCGLIAGLILSKFLRFFAMMRGQHLGRYRWPILACTCLGALASGTRAVVD